MHIMLFNLVIQFLVLLAKTCTMPPPPPDGGSVTVHSEGYMYGKNCSTGGIYVPIEPIGGGGCGIPKFTQMERKIVGNDIESKYKITIDKSPPGGAAALLLTFSQPVTPASVVITGSVRYFCSSASVTISQRYLFCFRGHWQSVKVQVTHHLSWKCSFR